MSGAASRASGSVTVVGGRGESLGGQRLGRQAWQDIRRACRLAGESDRVRAVDIRGVHISFFPSEPRDRKYIIQIRIVLLRSNK